MDIVTWSREVAALALDRLIDEGFLKREDFEAALGPAAEEIQIRLAMGDHPPVDGCRNPAPCNSVCHWRCSTNKASLLTAR